MIMLTNQKNRKIDFSFDLAHCASFIKTGARLGGEGGGGLLMSNRQNVEPEKCPTDKISTDKMHVIPCKQNTD